MSSSLREIGADELWEAITAESALVIVDALSPISYAASHLPGAINITPETVDEQAPRRIPDRHVKVVVYCSNSSCDASTIVANRLVELGYDNVRPYPGGKEQWAAIGLPLEGGRV
jgi:rhodanese-related sulfurtransferase